MCDPVTTTLAAIGAVAGVAGSVQQGMSAKSAANYNAKLARDQAQQEVDSAAFDEQRSRDTSRRKLSSQKAGYASSGVTTDSGSAEAVASDDTMQAELDALAIRYGGALRARSYRAEASSEKASGGRALTGSIFAAGSTLATKGADMYAAYHPPVAK